MQINYTSSSRNCSNLYYIRRICIICDTKMIKKGLPCDHWFIIFDNRSGLYIDYATSIPERSRKIRELKEHYGFDVGWNYYNEEFPKWQKPYFTLETTIVRNHYPERITQWYEQGKLKRCES